MLRSELSNNNEGILSADSTLSQQFSTKNFGNRCGHDKNNFKRPEYSGDNKRRPFCVEEAKRRLRSAQNNPQHFPLLAELIYNADNRNRKFRSEFREGSACLVLTAILHNLWLHTMSFGHPDNDEKFRYLGYERIRNVTQLSNARIYSAMALLKKLEIISVQPIWQFKEDGTVKTREVRIKVSPKIFDMLGLTKEFLKDRKKQEEKYYKKDLKKKNKMKQLECFRPITKFRQTAKSTPKSNHTILPSMRMKEQIERPASRFSQNVNQLAMELFKAKLVSSTREAYELACQKLGLPPPN